jgi:hypothetical protein
MSPQHISEGQGPEIPKTSYFVNMLRVDVGVVEVLGFHNTSHDKIKLDHKELALGC